MIIEEKKSYEQICPMDMALDHGYKCQGSRCMAWRWADPFNEGEDDLPASWHSTTHGYCGLAGRP